MTSEVENYKENLMVFDLSGKLLGMQDRSQFYKEIREEFKKTGKVTRQVHTIRMFLMSSKGGIYLAKRSKLKKENGLLYDKTLGGHIRAEESAEYTLLRECAEELGFPAAALNDEEFITALSEADLNMMGMFKKIEVINAFQAKYKYKDGSRSIFPQIATVFIGVYDGSIRFKDGETSGVEIYYPNEIEEELQKYPEKYTEDVKILIPKYLDKIKELTAYIEKIK